MNPAPPGGGLFGSARALAGTLVAMLQTRLELLVTELREERLRLGAVLLFGAVAFFFLGFGCVLLALFLTVLLWDSHRLLALGVCTALFLGAGATAAILSMRRVRQGAHAFEATLDELARDRDALRGGEQRHE